MPGWGDIAKTYMRLYKSGSQHPGEVQSDTDRGLLAVGKWLGSSPTFGVVKLPKSTTYFWVCVFCNTSDPLLLDGLSKSKAILGVAVQEKCPCGVAAPLGAATFPYPLV